MISRLPERQSEQGPSKESRPLEGMHPFIPRPAFHDCLKRATGLGSKIQGSRPA